MNLIVLAGGFGTRLRSAVSEVPKPLAPVADHPYLHYLIQCWIDQGITDFTFLLHHQAHLIEEFLNSERQEGCLNGCTVRTLTEAQPLGTGGAIAYAVQQLQMSGPFLVANADTWLGSGMRQITQTQMPAVAMVKVENAERYGQVQIQGDKVIAFEEKQSSAGAGWINAGLYHLHAELFADWNGEPFSLESNVFPKLVNAGRLTAVTLETDFIDIGIPQDYFRFCRWIESGKVGIL